ncbi:uncharacterized protein LOC135491543 [Lineus longissimus]|uniref:uncharacterized protein LOC135491543 n=1 Tax=Lineus longissimus TaxID=88925 RepID=UPI00315D2D28
MRRKDFDPANRLLVRFHGEAGIDEGGVAKEFLQLLLPAIINAGILIGEQGKLTVSSSTLMLQERLYFYAGQLEKSDSALLTDNLTEIAGTIGFTNVLKLETKSNFLRTAALHYTVIRNRAQLEQFLDGMKVLGLNRIFEQCPGTAKQIFCGGNKCATADDVYNLFTIEYSEEGCNNRKLEDDVMMSFLFFLADCKSGNLACSLEDFLQFLSGLRSIPPGGFDIPPRITFTNDKRLPSVSTCALELKLCRCEADFSERMVLGVLGAPDFGLA